jgi:hypothetical protein
MRLYRFAYNLFRLPRKYKLETAIPGKDLQLLTCVFWILGFQINCKDSGDLKFVDKNIPAFLLS